MIHWLQYGGMKCKKETEQAQIAELIRYLTENPSAKALIYFKESGDWTAKVVKLECHQVYHDLDLDCNSGDRSFRHFDRKTKNITPAPIFTEQTIGKEISDRK